MHQWWWVPLESLQFFGALNVHLWCLHAYRVWLGRYLITHLKKRMFFGQVHVVHISIILLYFMRQDTKSSTLRSSQMSHISCTILRKHLTHCVSCAKSHMPFFFEVWYTPRDVNVDFINVWSIRFQSDDDNIDYYDYSNSRFCFLAPMGNTLLF